MDSTYTEVELAKAEVETTTAEVETTTAEVETTTTEVGVFVELIFHKYRRRRVGIFCRVGFSQVSMVLVIGSNQ